MNISHANYENNQLDTWKNTGYKRSMELKEFWIDLRHSLRTLSRRPSFALLTIVTMGLGMGAVLCILFVMNSVLFQRLPFPAPEKLVMVVSTNRDATGKLEEYGSSPHDFLDWRRSNRTFEQMAAMEMGEVAVTDPPEPAQVQSLSTSSNFFSLLGVHPQLGRYFLPEEENPESHVAFISDELWRRFYGRRPDIVGRAMEIDGVPYRIVGVAAPGFHFAVPTDIWLPMNLRLDRSNPVTSRTLFVVGRFRPNVSQTEASVDLSQIATQLAKTYPSTNEGWGVKLLAADENIKREVRVPVSVLGIAVVILLLIACVNVSGLILNRAVERETEIAMRLALGATTRHLFRYILSENLLITLTGAVLGFLLAALSVNPLVRYGPTLPLGTLDLGLLENLHISFSGLLISIALAILIAIVLAALPVWLSQKNDVIADLHGAGRSITASSHLRTRQSVLLIFQLTAATLLLALTFGVLKTFWKLSAVSSGFDTKNITIIKLALPASRYEDHEKRAIFLQQFLREVRAINGIMNAGVTSRLPLNEFSFTTSFDIEGRPTSPADAPVSNFRRISDGYFKTMRARMVEGREFESVDTSENLAVAIVNRKLAETFWPGQTAIGKKLKRQSGKDPQRTIIGVVDDVRELSYSQPVSPVLYIPYSQGSSPVFYCMIRSSLKRQDLVSNVRRVLGRIDPLLPLGEVQTMEEWQSKTLSRPRFTAFLLVVFSAIAFAVSLVGVFGNVRGWVLTRFREIGIRLAYGATHGSIIGMFVVRAAKMVLFGISAGMLVTFLSAKSITSFFDSKYAIDYPSTFLAGSVMAAICILSAFVSARASRKVSPSALLNQV